MIKSFCIHIGRKISSLAKSSALWDAIVYSLCYK